MATCCKITSVAILAILGVLLIIGGGVWQGIHKNVVNNIIKKDMVITPGSKLYPKWTSSPVPYQKKYYFYHWTNPWSWDTVNNDNTSANEPIFKIVGPYTYTETKVKQNITFNDDNDTVSYEEVKTYYFDRENSVGDSTDNVTVLNIPLVAGLAAAQKLGLLNALSIVLNGMYLLKEFELYVEHTVDELLYSGYNDAIITAFYTGDPAMDGAFPGEKFAIYNAKNETSDGLYQVYRGNADASQLGKVVTVNGSTQLPYYSSYCNDLNGTDGTIFGADAQKQTYYIYQGDNYRSVHVDYEEEVTVSGISAYRYVLADNLLSYGSVNPDNWCFCQTNDTCPLSGLLDISPAYYYSAILASQANCLDCDPIVFNQTIGMVPDSVNNVTYVDVEPNTGMSIRSSKSLQVNVGMTSYTTRRFTHMENLPTIVFPIMMFQEYAVIDDDLADYLNDNVLRYVSIAGFINYICYGVGAALIILAVVIGMCCKC